MRIQASYSFLQWVGLYTDDLLCCYVVFHWTYIDLIFFLWQVSWIGYIIVFPYYIQNNTKLSISSLENYLLLCSVYFASTYSIRQTDGIFYVGYDSSMAYKCFYLSYYSCCLASFFSFSFILISSFLRFGDNFMFWFFHIFWVCMIFKNIIGLHWLRCAISKIHGSEQKVFNNF